MLDQAGQAWLLSGDADSAYNDAGAAVALAPGDPDLLIDRAEAAGQAGWYDKAVADLDAVLKADPRRLEALIYRATAYRNLKRLDLALADAEFGGAARPTRPKPCSSAGIFAGCGAISTAPGRIGWRRPVWLRAAPRRLPRNQISRI